ncbi:ESP1 [Hirschfeldia incana]|nr:ESP1 [Hirschfeldia incana]
MAGKQIGGEGGVPENLAGMTKSQLYDIMSQMKTLIDQNHEQARDILIRNPLLTKALFQAQIMLGMVQPPQVPKVDPQVTAQPPQQSRQSIPTKPNVQAHVSSVQGGESAAPMQPQAPNRKHQMQQQQQQPMSMPMPMPPPPPPPSVVSAASNAPSQQPRFSHPQRQGHLNPAGTSLSHPQVQNAPSLAPHHPTSQQPQFHHLDIPASSTQLQQQQQPMHSVGGSHLPPQQQARPYHHQFGPPSQPGPNAGFQHHVAPPQHHSQPMFHSGNRPPASGGPQFPQGQPHLPSQQPYQGGGQFRGDYNNNQLGGPMAAERGPSWMAGQPENSNTTHLPGLGPVPPPNQVGPGGGPPPRPAPISADMEKALLQQVMSLTPEQINLLPPEQRNQVLQLQQILRQ